MQPTADGGAVNPSPWIPVVIRLLDWYERATFEHRPEPFRRALGWWICTLVAALAALWIWVGVK